MSYILRKASVVDNPQESESTTRIPAFPSTTFQLCPHLNRRAKIFLNSLLPFGPSKRTFIIIIAQEYGTDRFPRIVINYCGNAVVGELT